VANPRTIKPSNDQDVLAVEGDISEPAATDRIFGGALECCGRIDTLINNAGVCIATGLGAVDQG
jgi:NAD(P)-dependent dehydrogenase (short-subunit alcohol dehydrogenase family)